MDSTCVLCDCVWNSWNYCLYDRVPGAFRIVNRVYRGNMAHCQGNCGNPTMAHLKNFQKRFQKIAQHFCVELFYFFTGGRAAAEKSGTSTFFPVKVHFLQFSTPSCIKTLIFTKSCIIRTNKIKYHIRAIKCRTLHCLFRYKVL